MGSFSEEITETLVELRADEESRMLDVFDICVVTGTEYVDKKDQPVLEVLFRTCGRVKVLDVITPHRAEVGARTSVEVTRMLKIPVASPAVPTGALAVPVQLHWSSDQTLAGAKLRLSGPAPGSQTTARRLAVSEVLT